MTISLETKNHTGNESGPTVYNDSKSDSLIIETEANRVADAVDPEHNSDGTHGDINAESVKVQGVNIGATDSGTATSVGALDITQTGKGWGTNVFATGHTVTYQSGGNDAVADITANDADSLTLAGGSAAPDASTPFSIYGNGDPSLPQVFANGMGSEAIFENQLPNSGFGVWSNSQDLYDVTTDAAPVVTGADAALVAGGSLVSNGGFDSATTGWTPTACTLASVAGGETGNCLELTRTTGGSQNAKSIVMALTAGKIYQISARVKSGTSGDEAFQLWPYNAGDTGHIYDGSSTAAWVVHTFTFISSVTGDYALHLYKITATAGTMLFDTVTLNEVTPGIVSGTNGPDGMYKSTTLSVFREHSGANTKIGSFYAVKLVPSAVNTYLAFAPLAIVTTESWLDKFRGRTVAQGMWIKTSTANHARAAIYDGAFYFSDYHTGGGGWEWLEVPRAVGSSSGDFEPAVHLTQSSGDVYCSQPMLVFGSKIGEGNYSQPKGEVIWFDEAVNSTKFDAITGFAPAGGWNTISVLADSNGSIPAGAKGFLYTAEANDAGSAAGVPKMIMQQHSTRTSKVVVSPAGLANDVRARMNGEVLINDDDTVRYYVFESGGGTFDIPAFHYEGVRL
jgi:hypothetical protein